MYHRENRYPSDWRIPQNYSGSTFRNTQDEVREATEDLTRNEPPALPASAEEKDEGRAQPAVLSRSSRMDFKRILRGELTAEDMLLLALILLIATGEHADDTVLFLILLLFL
ncbi:MAG: hypothetical protein E7664_04240 [Ruminococcaceae bacterium]|nr:hypothetical protein [Oscillospiraceae bacterium]